MHDVGGQRQLLFVTQTFACQGVKLNGAVVADAVKGGQQMHGEILQREVRQLVAESTAGGQNRLADGADCRVNGALPQQTAGGTVQRTLQQCGHAAATILFAAGNRQPAIGAAFDSQRISAQLLADTGEIPCQLRAGNVQFIGQRFGLEPVGGGQ